MFGVAMNQSFLKEEQYHIRSCTSSVKSDSDLARDLPGVLDNHAQCGSFTSSQRARYSSQSDDFFSRWGLYVVETTGSVITVVQLLLIFLWRILSTIFARRLCTVTLLVLVDMLLPNPVFMPL